MQNPKSIIIILTIISILALSLGFGFGYILGKEGKTAPIIIEKAPS